MRSFAVLTFCSCLASCSGGVDIRCEPNFVFQKNIDTDLFFKGNTHTHTERSFDSNELIIDVLGWFRDADYDFVVLTDHDISSVPSEFSAFEESGEFIAIAGEEVTSIGITPEGESKPVHVNSICSNGTSVGGMALDGTANALIDSVDRVIAFADAIPQVNHPNFEYALRAEDILVADGARLIEIANQHPNVKNAGDADHVSTEVMWDEILSQGMVIYGVASDDTHQLSPDSYTPPGRAWIQVAADDLSVGAICESLAAGAFYSSTGVTLSRLRVSERAMQLEIILETGEAGNAYVTTFTGSDGVILKVAEGLAPRFELTGYQQFVRATVRAPDGGVAWIQPYFVEETNVCDSP